MRVKGRKPDPPPARPRPCGFPLVDFLHTGAFAEVGKHPGKQVAVKGTRPRPTKPEVSREDLERLLEGVCLCRFTSNVLKGKQPQYVFDVGLDSARTVGFVVRNPFDTVIAFGGGPPHGEGHLGLPAFPELVRTGPGSVSVRAYRRTPTRPRTKGARPSGSHARAPCDLNLRFVLDATGQLRTLQLYGPSIRVFFSKGLIRPVRKNSQGKYVPTGERAGVALGDAVITLARGRAPHVTKALVLEDTVVQIAGPGTIARLRTVTLGGTFAKPKLVFDDVELL